MATFPTTCYSVVRDDFGYCKAVVAGAGTCNVEIRLDECPLDAEQLRALAATKRRSRILAACHIGKVPSEKAFEMLFNAVAAGFDIIDIPVEMPEEKISALVAEAKKNKVKVIVSYHNYESTPERQDLRGIVFNCYRLGADIAKVVCKASCKAEADRLTGLYKFFPHTSRLIAFAMGDRWRQTRAAAVSKGSPLNYVALTRSSLSAEGQKTYYDLLGPRETVALNQAGVPVSKSYAQRAIIASAIAGDRNYSSAFSFGMLPGDVLSAMDVAEQFKGKILFVGESGLLARMMIPLCRALPQQADREQTIIAGKGTLMHRDLAKQCCQLEQMGLRTDFYDASHLPCTVRGRLRSGHYNVSAAEGSQMISGLLFALPLCEGDSTLAVTDIRSVPYMLMTVDVLGSFGVKIGVEQSAEKMVFRIPGGQQYRSSGEMKLEKDWSSAAMMLACGVLLGEATVRGMNTLSLQSDRAVLDVLRGCGADMEIKGTESRAEINVRRSILSPLNYDITNTPDLFPALVLIALRCVGESRIRGIGCLRNKESDRAETFCRELSKTGVEIRREGDSILVEGLLPGQVLQGAAVSSHGDHRLAMALMAVSRITSGRLLIDDTQCVDKSFPGFLDFIMMGK